MRKIILRSRISDRRDFENIKNGLKTVETRAATKRYRNIKKGDTLVIVCGREKLIKKVKSARHFRSIPSMARVIPLQKVMPAAQSLAEMKKIYYGYPGYKEKIKRFGIVALWI